MLLKFSGTKILVHVLNLCTNRLIVHVQSLKGGGLLILAKWVVGLGVQACVSVVQHSTSNFTKGHEKKSLNSTEKGRRKE